MYVILQLHNVMMKTTVWRGMHIDFNEETNRMMLITMMKQTK